MKIGQILPLLRYLVIAVALGFIIYVYHDLSGLLHDRNRLDHQNALNSKTDTLWIQAPFNPMIIPNTSLGTTQPITLKLYTPSLPIRDSMVILRLTILADSLQRILRASYKDSSLTLRPEFLTNWPRNPKLLEMDLAQDSLSLTLLSPEGKTSSSIYSIQPLKYRYLWKENQLHVIPLPLRPSTTFQTHLYSICGVQSILPSTPFAPYLGLQYSVSLKRMSLESNLWASPTPGHYLGADLKLKLRLK